MTTIETTRRLIDRYYRLGDISAGAELAGSHGTVIDGTLAVGRELARQADRLANVDHSAVKATQTAALAKAVDAAASDYRTRLKATIATVFDAPEREARRYKKERLAIINGIGRGIAPGVSESLRALADAHQNVIASHRRTGGKPVLHPSSDPVKASVVDLAASMLPAAWIRTSAGFAPLAVAATTGRAEYRERGGISSETVTSQPSRQQLSMTDVLYWRVLDSYGDGSHLVQDMQVSVAVKPKGAGWRRNEIAGRHIQRGQYVHAPVGTVWVRESRGLLPSPALNVSDLTAPAAGRPAGFGTAVHELGHHLEATVPGLREAAREWVTSRQDGTEVTWGGEPCRGGDWAHPYIGRRNDNSDGTIRSTEVISCGLAALLAGDMGGLIGAASNTSSDEDLRAFMLGLLASVGVEGEV